MTWQAGLPSVSTTAGDGCRKASALRYSTQTSQQNNKTRESKPHDAFDVLAEMPCLVTDKKACELEADPIASMAIWSEPSVPFLNPIGIDIPEASSRCTCDSVAAGASSCHRKGVSRVIRLYHDQLLLPDSVHRRQTLTSCADGTPRDQIGNVLRRDGVEEFARGRETNVGDFEQESAREPETLVDLVRAVQLRVYRCSTRVRLS